MKEKTFRATLESIGPATAFVEAALEEAECSMKAQMQINVAMDELFANIARYAYPDGEGDATVRFELDPATRTAQITLIDHGIPFNPLEVREPDTTSPGEKRPIGGLGIFLVRKTMDDMAYEYRDGFVTVTLGELYIHAMVVAEY